MAIMILVYWSVEALKLHRYILQKLDWDFQEGLLDLPCSLCTYSWEHYLKVFRNN